MNTAEEDSLGAPAPALRRAALGFALLFTAVVASGWVPGWYAWVGKERIQWGLFALSPLDDITHGVTALAMLVAGLRSARIARLALVTFGSYYALDAIFFLLYGAMNDKPWPADLALNAPHVTISVAMLGLAYGPARWWGRLGRDAVPVAGGARGRA